MFRRASGALPSAWACWAFLVLASGWAAVYFAFPERHLWFWTPLGLSAVLACLWGVRRNRPGRLMPWYLFAASLLCFVTGDTYYNVMTDVLGRENPFPSWADVFYLAMYPLMAFGLASLVRARTVSRDRAALLDALTLTIGIGLLSWVYLVLPYFTVTGLTWEQRATSVAYPLGDVLVLAMLARLVGRGAHSWALRLLAMGGVGLLSADVCYGWIQLNGEWRVGGWVDLGWVVCYLAWGAAALHPSMRQVSTPQALPRQDISGRQIILLTLTSLIAPTIAITSVLIGSDPHPATVGIFSAALFMLVILRMTGIVRVHGQAVERERVLRSCGEALVAASTTEAVLDAVLAAARQLTAAQQQDVVGLYLIREGELRPVAGDVLPDIAMTRGSDFSSTASQLLDGARLSLHPLRPDHGPGGVLVVYRRAPISAELHDALHALAAHAALALEAVAQAEDAHRLRQDSRFKALIQHASDVLLVVQASGVVGYASPSTTRQLGWDGNAVEGTDFADLVAEPDRADWRATLARLLAQGSGSVLVRDWSLRRSDGGTTAVEAVLQNLLDDENVAGVVLTMRDVTERRELERQLAHQAFHDALTGLPNRLLFQDRVEQSLSRMSRHGGLAAVLMLDLDEFKIVNDTLGHEVGDRLLKVVGQRLNEGVRGGDTVARLGGDEFAVLIDSVADPLEAHRTAERLIHHIAGPITFPEGLLHAEVSCGLVLVDGSQPDLSMADLMRNADLALYAAKDQGRGVVVAYDEAQRVKMADRMTRKNDLHQAIEQRQFQLLYQPIVEIGSGEVVGAEALVRWRHPERGLVSPQEFIPLAEQTGLIGDLGAWVLDEACRQSAEWTSTVGRVRMSVNVSGRQFQHIALVDYVESLLDTYRLASQDLVLEITESVLMIDDSAVLGQLQRLHSLGVAIAVDDFGVGYSSLGYLRRFPIDILKVDKSFTDSLGTDPQDGALVQAVISMAQALQLKAVAEGIETAIQRDRLWSLGCELGQGFLYARPLPPEEFAALMANPLGPPPPRVGHLPTFLPPPPRRPVGPIASRSPR